MKRRNLHAFRVKQYQKLLVRRGNGSGMPKLLSALSLIALLLGIALPFRMSATQASAELLNVIGITPTPRPSSTPAPAPVRHVVLSTLAPSPTPEKPRPTPSPTQSKDVEILIYHTHATEAYRQTDEYSYESSGNCRTEDGSKNVTALGTLLESLLEGVYGYNVIHDTANYEPPKLATAYTRSLPAMQKYKKENESLRYMIDVHRDAYGSSPSGEKDFVLIDGKECAKLMFVVGTGKGATGTGFTDMPDFGENYAFAEGITRLLRGTNENLARDIRVKSGRYNQHVTDRCLLVEIGHNANTFDQAVNSVPHLAKAIAEAIKRDAASASQ